METSQVVEKRSKLFRWFFGPDLGGHYDLSAPLHISGQSTGWGVRWLGLLLAIIVVLPANLFGAPQPVVAIHDSELTRALESMPATGTIPSGPGSTGFQWWPTNWHYFVMPEALKEALRSDGTLFAVVSDADIAAGALLDGSGNPRFPIVISLASEAIQDGEIAPLTNYVAAGGFLLAGSSSFTRHPDGSSRGDFAIADALGLHTVASDVSNWIPNLTFAKQLDHRLVSHIPSGQLTWRMPTAADEISWGISPAHIFQGSHALWQVQVSDATVVSQGDLSPYLTTKQYGKGQCIYDAAMQPLIGHGGWAPGMYAYAIFRKAIEWAFEASREPVPKLSPWPFQYDAALMVRHDLENYGNEITNIEASAQVEFTNGVKGEYYFCTGTLREEVPDTNAAIAGLRSAVTNYQATIGSHNGGLRNPNNPSLILPNYDYWHWGPDEALDTDVSALGYPDGKSYAFTSISNSYIDIESWLSGTPNFKRSFVGCYFNSTREDSYDILNRLGNKTVGDQKLSPFPHWTVSTKTPGQLYPMLTLPVSDWFVGNQVSQALENGHTSGSMHAGVDFYYSMGALVNFYSHTLSTGLGAAGPLTPDYITYSMNTNLHPRLWPANSQDIYLWWLQRSNAQIAATFSTNGNRSITHLTVIGATDPNTSVEVLVPVSYAFVNLSILTNGIAAAPGAYRVVGQAIKVLVGTSVTSVEVDYDLSPKAQDDLYTLGAGSSLALSTPGVMANDSPGSLAELVTGPANGTLTLTNNGGFSYQPTPGFSGVDGFTYQIHDGLEVSAPATVTLVVDRPGCFFYDDFGRATDPGAVSPWTSLRGNWTVNSGVLQGGVNQTRTYNNIYYPTLWTNYSVECRIKFPSGAYGGGIAGRLNPLTGQRYGAWLYPEGSKGIPGGAATLQLFNFQNWDTWEYLGVSGAPMQQVLIPNLGTNWHKLKMGFYSNQISVYLDDAELVSVPDLEDGPFLTGAISIDMWSDVSPSILSVDDVLVRPLVVDDSYVANANVDLEMPAPGVLGNDTEVYGTNLTASLLVAPARGIVTLANNGGFTFTPDPNFVGSDSFTYQAYDGLTNLGSATVTLVVVPAVTVIADNKTRPYRTSDPPLTGTLLGVLAGDNITVTYGVGADLLSPAGAYDIIPVLHDPDGKLANYTATNIITGTLTITPAVLTVTADDKTRAYGAPNPPLTSRIAGFVDAGDTNSVTGTPILNTTANDTSPAGPYAITVDVGSLSAPNYTFTGVDGTLTVLPPPNTPPVLPGQVDRSVSDLATLTVVNTATDSDIPANTLTYQLINPPAGMHISPSGIITWVPTLFQSPSTTLITTIVTDNGVPPLSDTNKFMVIVSGPYDGINLGDPVQALADLDRDGLSNLAEYGLGTDPQNPGDANAGLKTAMISNGGNQYASLQFRRRKQDGGISLQYVPEVSGDGQTWFSDVAHVMEVSVTPLDDQFDSVMVRDLTPTSSPAPRFIRLRIVEN